MILKSSFEFINEFFNYFLNQIRKFYLNSSIYNKKISKTNLQSFEYKPSPNLLDCLIKYEKKKNKIEDFYINSIWEDNKISLKDYRRLHSFFWLFSLDLKSSKKITQSIISNWINSNYNYNPKNWELDILSKRIISWISNSKLSYEDSDNKYKFSFNSIIKKQINHLINEITRSNWIDDKMIGCAAIVLAGLSYKDEKYLNFGLNLLKKIINLSFDEDGFPKSRNIRQLIFYLKYFVLIREWFKESQNEIPDYLNEIIFLLGQSYNFIWQNINKSLLFNGNHKSDNSDFDKYLKFHNYKFKNESNEFGGYTVLKNKNTILTIDIGSSPEKKFSKDYQSGPLSFEIYFKDTKLVSNSGYFQNYKHQLNSISKSTANHSTLCIDNRSSCKFKKRTDGIFEIEKGIKVVKKNITFEKNYWSVTGSHDGYLKNYGIIHERKIEFFPDLNKFIGKDKLIKKKNFKSSNFEVRFHFEPGTKITKTQEGKYILIEIYNSGWRFSCNNHLIGVETGLYFGNKNSYIENQNIFISGISRNEDQEIQWEFNKI
tara:strand:+ start:1239 stop:2867 length:1629 start_codon:yes stop_codon:yes gene_type:complete